MLNKTEITKAMSKKLKLIRVEHGYSQDEMAEILGISKKTLVQIEKGRVSISWTLAVAVTALFSESEVLQDLLGSDPLEVLEVVARQNVATPKEKTLGGKVWWVEIESLGGYRMQQNIISKHYRILDDHHYRWLSTMDKDRALRYLYKLGDTLVENRD